MDPRHPELSITRIRELYNQYLRVLDDIKKSTTSAKLGELEREGTLVVQEMYIVTPRLHEALMQASRQHRSDIAKGLFTEPQDTIVENPVEKYVAPNQAETVFVEPKPRKKKTTKKAKK